MVFNRMNSASCSGSQFQATFLLVRPRRLAVRCAMSGLKSVNCAANPSNDLRLVVSVGLGRFAREASREGSGLIPASETIYPANFTLEPSSNFLSDMVTLFCLHLSRTAVIFFFNSAGEVAQTIMSSTIFFCER